MPLSNKAKGQLTFKLVYCGPTGSGKTANVDSLRKLVAKQHCSEPMRLEGSEDRVPFFDLLPVFFRIGELGVRIQVFAVPAKPTSLMTRRAVLQGAAGVVFVVDSSPSRASQNQAAFVELDQELKRRDGSESMPFVTQFNKRDLADALPAISFASESVYEASATTGQGVADTFLAVMEQIWEADPKHSDLLEEELTAAQFREALAALFTRS